MRKKKLQRKEELSKDRKYYLELAMKFSNKCKSLKD